MRIILLLTFLLSACASPPAFRKASENEFGYAIKASDRLEIFDVRAAMPETAAPEFRLDYLTRAAGEECLARGFMFWDIGSLGTNALRAFCFKRPSKKSLGVLMNTKNPKALVVEDTVPNSYSPFRANDVVRKIGGVEVENIGGFKEQIFRLSESDRREVTVNIERSGIALSLQAPFSEQREAIFTPEMLETLRKKLP